VPGLPRAASWWARRRELAAERRRLEELRRRDERLLAELAGRRDLLLNVGSSDNELEGWVNLDLRPAERSIQMDATRPWLFADGSARAVNSEHFIEHLSVDEARAYLAEAFRVLRPGGVLRTSTPDLRGLCEAYLAADPAVLDAHRSHGYEAATHGDMLNNYVYLWDHRHIWDLTSLTLLLEEAGFTDVTPASFNRSTHDLLDGIDRHDPGPLASLVLCMDALRP
jgi:predicted SAM-dependent methyltransferase